MYISLSTYICPPLHTLAARRKHARRTAELGGGTYTILHTQLYTLYSILYTLYCILCALYSILYTRFSVPYTVHYILYRLYPIYNTIYIYIYIYILQSCFAAGGLQRASIQKIGGRRGEVHAIRASTEVTFRQSALTIGIFRGPLVRGPLIISLHVRIS